MKQIQGQAQVQKLALTQTMRNSLSLLAMGQEEVAEVIRQEQSRNAFLKWVPSASSHATANRESVDTAAIETEVDNLLQQIRLTRLSDRQAGIAEGLVHSLDQRGFLHDPPQEIARYLDCDTDELVSLVARLQNEVEPVGVFAWSLADCFRLQLVAKNRFDPLIERLLERLDLIARQDIAAICSECCVDEEDAIDMLKDIRSLNPAPLGDHKAVPATARAPDILILLDEDGGLSAKLNEAAMPALLVDDALFSTTMAAETDDYARSYYRHCYHEAANIVRAMQKRANTLLATGKAITQKQEKFIRTGRERDKRPLTMAQLGSEIGVNKSTISRAMAECSIKTERGTFPASQFLARPLNCKGSEKTRYQGLQRLKILIATENPSRPYCDEELTSQLKKTGLTMSRRTVAKYRSILDIPGAYDRREK